MMTQDKNVPDLRFLGFSEDWQLLKIKQFVIDKKGAMKIGPFGSQLKKDTFVESGFKVYGQENIFANDFSFGNRYISVKHFEQLKSNELFSGDFVISTMGTIGKCAVMPLSIERGIMDSHMIRLQLDRNIISSDFLTQLFSLFKTLKQIKNLSVGGIMDGLSMGIINELKFHLPKLPEQQKIAAFLTAVDEKIQQLAKKKDLLEQYKKGVIQKIFNQEIRFKDDNGNDFADWEDLKLGDVTKLFSSRNRKLTDAKVYSVTNTKGFVLQSDHFDREIAGSDLTKYKIIERNDFSYNPARINVGSIAHFQYEIGIISSLYVCFRTTEKLDDTFLLNLLDLDHTKYQISNLGEGGVRIYLWYDLFALIKIKLPSLPEQKKIVAFLTAIDDKIKSVNWQLEKTKEYKKGLLQQMFI